MFSKLVIACFCLSAVLPAFASPTPYTPPTYSSGENYDVDNGYTGTGDDDTNSGYPVTDSYIPATPNLVDDDYLPVDSYIPVDTYNPPTDDNTYPTTSHPAGGDIVTNQCNIGTVQCCDTIQTADGQDVTGLLGALLGAGLGSFTDLMGASCNPIDVIGAGGDFCSTQPVCCTDNDLESLASTGCTPTI
ncbi:hypothetical protein BDN72DRAFT_901507 [Pluteus cervinus]|uniref:Uncharacterized protein n=1 Tax=Pluteus cervinus TaxID=181527 RepID=A0ACD3AG27_9AGAR|nr:hypothetical protein BDN72DRAFT_901507 [Pluteus cervinus]